ncbi:twin-arginine translocation signal domain-containing protein [Bradyrhizobium sp. RDT10]
MAQANIDDSTSTSAVSSRRGFLAQAAVAAAGGAALGMALPLPVSAGSAERVPDPILTLIEAHKAAAAATKAAVDRNSAFENELHANGRLRQPDRAEDERRRGKSWKRL